MDLLRTREQLDAWRDHSPESLALVPTMGALHDGHLCHIDVAKQHAPRVIVSIFVNPTQFGPGEDFERYPRVLDRDLELCEQRDADAVFVPDVETIYPPPPEGPPAVEIGVPSVADQLEGAHRPGHFAGVCRVVMKLLGMVRPDAATFGRKDYQQLTVVRALLTDLAVPVRVIEVPTLREPDGLAMSSRNAYLTPKERERAVGLITALREAKARVDDGGTDPVALEATMQAVLADHGIDGVDYAAVRHARTLAPLEPGFAPPDAVALIAARVGTTRLIDNLPLW